MKINFLTKKYFSLGLILFIISSSFLFGHYVSALELGVSIAQILGHVISAIISALGLILTTLFRILIWVCGYNDFIKSAAVTNGWVIVRDLCNMFFILILLVIAFATILRLPNYEWKKLLPKLLIMAVLINFSKTICGLIIDFAQVIMLTFVNGFAAAGEANLTTMLGIDKILSINPETNNVTGLTIFGSYMLALIYVIIALIVTVVIIAVLVMRMVMLWVYVVLSPIAFLAAAFPAGQKYASQWWGEFSKNVIVGPVLAFFIWLSFISATTGLDIKPETGATVSAAITVAGSRDNMIKFIISIGMLIGGLMVTQQLGGMAGAAAGKGMAAIQKGGALTGKGLLKGTRTVGSYGLDWASKKTGGRVDFNLARTWGRFKGQMDENKAERGVGIEQKVAAKAGEGNRLAMLTHGGLAAKNLSSWGGIKGFAMGRDRFKYNKEAEKLETERKGVMTKEESSEEVKRMSNQRVEIKTIDQDMQKQQDIIRGALSPEQKQGAVEKYKELKQQKEDKEKLLVTSMQEYKKKKVDGDKAKGLDKEIVDNRNKAQQVAFRGKEVVKGAEATAVAIQEKKITHIDNFSELGEIFKQAIREGNIGLQAAVARKMTKQGDYNELASIMKVGTGTKGMQDLAKIMEKQGGMSQQMSRGLVADMGVMCKNLGQFGGFASMEMDKSGNWQEANEDKAQGVQLAEMQKMEPQAFVRTVNRLGLGHYDDDGDPSKAGVHDESTWHLSKAATVYLKTNQEALGEQYQKRGMQNAIEHLASKIGQLTANGVKSGRGSLIETIEVRGHKGGTNPMEQVKTVKT